MKEDPLSRIELFEFDIPNNSVTGSPRSIPCKYGLLRITCGEYTGWGECLMCAGDEQFDLVRWSSYLQQLRHMPLDQAWNKVLTAENCWGSTRTELARMALLNLLTRIEEDLVVSTLSPSMVQAESSSFPRQLLSADRTGINLDYDSLFRDCQAYYSVL